MPWDEAQKEAFLRAQFDAQDRWYREHYARRELRRRPGRRRAGRAASTSHRGETEIRIVDIALLPEHRGSGVGTRAARATSSAEADAAGKRVTIHVERINPALRLYERLGFSVAEDKGVYLLLERPPAT